MVWLMNQQTLNFRVARNDQQVAKCGHVAEPALLCYIHILCNTIKLSLDSTSVNGP